MCKATKVPLQFQSKWIIYAHLALHSISHQIACDYDVHLYGVHLYQYPVSAKVMVCVCVCKMPYVNCFGRGRTVLYVCIEYCI